MTKRDAITPDARRPSMMLDELLAVIHRDGGHYQFEHGTEKAVADAIARIYHERTLCDAAAAPVQHDRRVVCAAIRASDGDVLLGIRHYSKDMHEQIAFRNDGSKFLRRHDEDQGFVDQRGVYMSRSEAYVVALAAGQIVHPERCGADPDGPKLYSEGLY